jgi:hypothetical protein
MATNRLLRFEMIAADDTKTPRHADETILLPREGNLKQTPGKQRREFNASII